MMLVEIRWSDSELPIHPRLPLYITAFSGEVVVVFHFFFARAGYKTPRTADQQQHRGKAVRFMFDNCGAQKNRRSGAFSKLWDLRFHTTLSEGVKNETSKSPGKIAREPAESTEFLPLPWRCVSLAHSRWTLAQLLVINKNPPPRLGICVPDRRKHHVTTLSKPI
jgi:hypothetical protein